MKLCKISFTFVLFVLGVIQVSLAQEDCGTPIECYEKALERLDIAQKVFEEKTVEFESRTTALESQPTIEQGIISIRGTEITNLLSPDGCEADRGIVNGRVDFGKSFTEIPSVMIGLTHFDVYTEVPFRLTLRVVSVDSSGFTYTFVTWCDTRLTSASANWIAIGH